MAPIIKYQQYWTFEQKRKFYLGWSSANGQQQADDAGTTTSISAPEPSSDTNSTKHKTKTKTRIAVTATTKFRCHLCRCDFIGTHQWLTHISEEPLHQKNRREMEEVLKMDVTVSNRLQELQINTTPYKDRIAAIPCRQWQDQIHSQLIGIITRDEYLHVHADIKDIAAWKRELNRYEKLGTAVVVRVGRLESNVSNANAVRWVQRYLGCIAMVNSGVETVETVHALLQRY